MSYLPDAVKNQLDDILAKVQGEVGRFLILKERIRALPASPLRDSLLTSQDSLEKKALDLIAQAPALKASLESFSPFDISKLASLGPLVQKASALAANGAQLVQDIAVHKANVETASSSSSSSAQSPASPQSASGPWLTRERLSQGVALAAMAAIPLGMLVGPVVVRYFKRRKS